MKREVIIKVVFPGHHINTLQEGSEGIVEHVVLPQRQVEGEGEGKQDSGEY